MSRGSAIRSFNVAVVLTGTVLIAGCVGEPARGTDIDALLSERNLARGAEVQEIRNYRIDGWNSLDDTHLIIRAGPSDSYLVTLMTRCSDLRSSETVAFSTTTGDVTRFDELTVRGAGGIVETCPITAIHELEPVR